MLADLRARGRIARAVPAGRELVDLIVDEYIPYPATCG